MPQVHGDKARIALLIMVAVLAITLAMLEALAHSPPSPVTASPSRLSGVEVTTETGPPSDDVSTARTPGSRASR
jgi:hypothetical protein